MIPRIEKQIPTTSLHTINSEFYTSTNNTTTTTTTFTSSLSTTTTTTTINNSNSNSNIDYNNDDDEFDVQFPSLSEIYSSGGLYNRIRNTCSNGDGETNKIVREKIKNKIKQQKEMEYHRQQQQEQQHQQQFPRSNSSPELEREENEILNAYNNEILNKHGWKKRDLLYFCFIQRNHENDRIIQFINAVSQYYKTSNECLLDLGCGIGRMFSHFHRSKWELIEAHEPDYDYYSFSNDYAKNLSDKIFVYQSGFLDLNIISKYDMVVSIHGPLQYLTDVKDRFKALQNIYNSLKPGGVVLVDVSNFLNGLTNLCTQMNQQKMMVNGVTVKRISNIQVNTLLGLWHTDDVFFSILENRKYSNIDDDDDDNNNTDDDDVDEDQDRDDKDNDKHLYNNDYDDDDECNNNNNNNNNYNYHNNHNNNNYHRRHHSEERFNRDSTTTTSKSNDKNDNSSFDIEYNDSGIVAEQHTFSILTLSELQLLLMSTGFINIRHASRWDFSNFISNDQDLLETNGHRIIIVGQKPFS